MVLFFLSISPVKVIAFYVAPDHSAADAKNPAGANSSPGFGLISEENKGHQQPCP